MKQIIIIQTNILIHFIYSTQKKKILGKISEFSEFSPGYKVCQVGMIIC